MLNKKMVTKYFNIHDLVKIKIQTKIQSKITEVLHQIREFERPFLDDKDVDMSIYDYSQCLNLENPLVFSKYYYSKNYLNVPEQKFCFNFIDYPIILYCDKFWIPLNFIIELILLKKNYTVIHSAAIKYRGRNYLFPAFSGTRKTTTVVAFLYHQGKLFGDDINIVNKKEIFSYPSSFSVYSYHLDILKIKNKQIKNKFKIDKIIDKIIDPLKKYNNYRIAKLLILVLNSLKTSYLNIPPKKIFGENCIVEKGQIDDIYYSCQVDNGLSEITFERIDSDKLAEICTNILFQEWHRSMSILYTYSGFAPFSLNSLFDKIKNAFQQTFALYKCYQINIPNNLNNLNYQKQLISYFNKKY